MIGAIDVIFAYVLSLITAIALNVIPDLNQKILYLVFSTTLIIVASFIRAWTGKGGDLMEEEEKMAVVDIAIEVHLYLSIDK